MLTNRERIVKTLNFQPVDRLPMIEWASWWNLTLERWYGEGLPQTLDRTGMYEYFGLDLHYQHWVPAFTPDIPSLGDVFPYITSREQYHELKKFLYPEKPFDEQEIRACAERQSRGELAVWLSFNGFFWFPRTLFGIEGHLYAFYDFPDLMKEINEDILAYNLRALNQFCEICTPDFMTFAEDMSYNHGPMLSKVQFDEFMAPYYKRIVPELLDRGIIPIVDSDGDITKPVEWFREVGVKGILPLERMAGVDVSALRVAHPDQRLIGAFDKTVMHLGEDRIRQEFERLLPVMHQGGFIPAVDHQTPPAVSIDDYRTYVRCLREYCEKAANS